MVETQTGGLSIESEFIEDAPALAGSIDLEAERVKGEFGRLPWRPWDRVLLEAARFYATHKIPFIDRDKKDDVIGPTTHNERLLVQRLTSRVWQGKKFSLAEMAKLMDGHPVEVVGRENLPIDTNFVVYGNHPNNSFFRSLGIQIAQDQLIYETTGRHTTYLMGHGSANPVINSGLMRVKPLYEQMGETSGQIVVNREYVRNGSAADKKSALQIARDIRLALEVKGNVLGVYPEEDDHRHMQQAKEEAGALFAFLSRRNLPFVPIGATAQGASLSLVIGEPFKLERHKKMSDREIIDRAMRRVALLLPKWQRGFYKEVDHR